MLNEPGPTPDVSLGAWIAPRLADAFGTVTDCVPTGYAAYARICHPATAPDRTPASWQTVADVTGRTAHALMQWHALVGSADSHNFAGSLWPGSPPERGNLGPGTLAALCEILAAESDEAECVMGVWNGWGEWVPLYSVTTDHDDKDHSDEPPAPPPYDPSDADAPTTPVLRLPGRDYLLYTGHVSSALALGQPMPSGGFHPQSPNIMWPTDRLWFLASEIDFDSTLIGGSEQLIRAILDDPALDSWPIGPDDSLAYDADKINHVPDRPARS